MKIGIRTPSLKKSISARTTGKLKRKMKSAVNPFYGKKGMGMIRNPKKAIYNKVYRKTTVSAGDAAKSMGCIGWCFVGPFYLAWLVLKYTCLGMYWLCALIVKGIVSFIKAIIKVIINKGSYVTEEGNSQVVPPMPVEETQNNLEISQDDCETEER